ncbi:basic salivary proline-rich protein 3-like [Cyprinodon tularosa]|uniref:basic salivary proline-rich protein 3-like n=1 Tax=Cyprinodon tularosa TaxID=77115 RepID=UPI0018E1DADA|nr:basic salivary proline-rich protein 3-like [Cyprinodon tularosa]
MEELPRATDEEVSLEAAQQLAPPEADPVPAPGIRGTKRASPTPRRSRPPAKPRRGRGQWRGPPGMMPSSPPGHHPSSTSALAAHDAPHHASPAPAPTERSHTPTRGHSKGTPDARNPPTTDTHEPRPQARPPTPPPGRRNHGKHHGQPPKPGTGRRGTPRRPAEQKHPGQHHKRTDARRPAPPSSSTATRPVAHVRHHGTPQEHRTRPPQDPPAAPQTPPRRGQQSPGPDPPGTPAPSTPPSPQDPRTPELAPAPHKTHPIAPHYTK